MESGISNLKIIFMGTPQIAADILAGLIASGLPISGVVTRPDKHRGRKSLLGFSEVKDVAQENEIPVDQPKNKIELEKIIFQKKPDLVLVAAFGMILPESVFEGPKYKALNVHPSLLPLYRGPAPIEAPILSGDKNTGVTIMKISAGMDEGDIVAQKKIELSGTETAPQLERSLAKLSVAMLTVVIPDWVAGKINAIPQDHDGATYTKMLKKEDGLIRWELETATMIERKSRAYQPWPGIYSYFNGKKLDFFDMEIVNRQLEPGKVTVENNRVYIGTQNNSVSPRFLRLEGKSKIPTSEFLRGYHDFSGSSLK